jgi:hypothetical protein
MAKIFDINADKMVELTNRLERLHRSALPVSIRGTLNDAAFDAKQRTIPVEFDNNFVVRKKNFIRSHTRAVKSKNTFDLNQMASHAGVIKGKSKSGDQLKYQERGGAINNRGAIPTEFSRVAKNASRLVRKAYYYNRYKNARKGVVTRTTKETIIKTNDSLLRVTRGSKWETLYRIRPTVSIKRDAFIEPASRKTMRMIPNFYKKQAMRRINK